MASVVFPHSEQQTHCSQASLCLPSCTEHSPCTLAAFHLKGTSLFTSGPNGFLQFPRHLLYPGRASSKILMGCLSQGLSASKGLQRLADKCQCSASSVLGGTIWELFLHSSPRMPPGIQPMNCGSVIAAPLSFIAQMTSHPHLSLLGHLPDECPLHKSL